MFSDINIFTYFIFSEACAIPDGDSMLVTGGFFTLTTVSRYSKAQGWVEDLPDLAVGRVRHGCTSFSMDNQEVTSVYQKIT